MEIVNFSCCNFGLYFMIYYHLCTIILVWRWPWSIFISMISVRFKCFSHNRIWIIFTFYIVQFIRTCFFLTTLFIIQITMIDLLITIRIIFQTIFLTFMMTILFANLLMFTRLQGIPCFQPAWKFNIQHLQHVTVLFHTLHIH